MLKITNVDYLGDYTLRCTFNTGEVKKVDLTPLLEYPAFKELKDKKQFMQFGLDGITIYWANGADIAPEYLYDNCSSLETAYIMSSPEMMAAIRQGEEDIRNGKGIKQTSGESLEDFLERTSKTSNE